MKIHIVINKIGQMDFPMCFLCVNLHSVTQILRDIQSKIHIILLKGLRNNPVLEFNFFNLLNKDMNYHKSPQSINGELKKLSKETFVFLETLVDKFAPFWNSWLRLLLLFSSKFYACFYTIGIYAIRLIERCVCF